MLLFFHCFRFERVYVLASMKRLRFFFFHFNKMHFLHSLAHTQTQSLQNFRNATLKSSNLVRDLIETFEKYCFNIIAANGISHFVERFYKHLFCVSKSKGICAMFIEVCVCLKWCSISIQLFMIKCSKWSVLQISHHVRFSIAKTKKKPNKQTNKQKKL